MHVAMMNPAPTTADGRGGSTFTTSPTPAVERATRQSSGRDAETLEARGQGARGARHHRRHKTFRFAPPSDPNRVHSLSTSQARCLFPSVWYRTIPALQWHSRPGTILYAELVQNPVRVLARRVVADAEQDRDFWTGLAMGDLLQHFGLPLAQPPSASSSVGAAFC